MFGTNLSVKKKKKKKFGPPPFLKSWIRHCAVKKSMLSAAEPEKKNFHATTSSRRAMRKYHMFSYHHRKIYVRDKFIVLAYYLFRDRTCVSPVLGNQSKSHILKHTLAHINTKRRAGITLQFAPEKSDYKTFITGLVGV